MAWHTLCIYGFGESQVIGDIGNKQAPNASLSSLGPVFTYLASIEQSGTDISAGTTHIINVFYGRYVEFIPNDISTNLGQVFPWATIDPSTIEDLAEEIEAI